MRASLEVERHGRTAFYFALLVALACVLCWHLGSLPGLHGDEAWVGLRAADILAGARPIVGMNYYTGALHQYVVACCFLLFGAGTWTLRLPSVIGALLALVS